MSRAVQWLKHKGGELLPIALFFFVVFNVRTITDALVFGRGTATPFSVLRLAVLALIVGKVLLLTDLLPFVNAFPGKPLIYNTLWKSLMYGLAALLYRLLEPLIPLIRRYHSLSDALPPYRANVDWSRFWGIQIWLFALLLLFVAARELVRAIGGGRVVGELFFRRRAA